jgi:hypothetical protein
LKSLFNTNFNWSFYLLSGLLIRLLFFEISWLSFFAVMISLYQFTLLFNSIGYIIPVRYLLGCFMCLQFFIGPTFAYNGLDTYQYQAYIMRVSETEYFSYVIPAVVLFILGLHINAGKLNGEVVNQQRVRQFVEKNPKIPYLFIIIGFLSSIISVLFSSEISFVFYLLGSFKFIGLFLVIIGNIRIKLLPFILVIGSIVSSSLGDGMFHDLLTWVIFIAAVFGIKYKFGFKIKVIGLTVFLLLAITIQLLKGAYRNTIRNDKESSGLETFVNLAEKQNEKDGGFFSFKSLASSNVRINQGFIITNIMNTVPSKVPFDDGKEMIQILEAAILPRILAPNKLNAGDKKIFTKFSGIQLRSGTSMGLSSVGDAYINFGIIGGCIFMFLLGLMYSSILNIFYKKSKIYPILILFPALVFYYPIRPDCELQTILGHLFKSCFLIFIIINVWKYNFYLPKMFKKPIQDLAV